MSDIEKLKELLENKILPDLEAVIDSIFQMIEREKAISLGEKEELQELQEMHKECRDILIEIEAGEMEEEEAKELLEELNNILAE
jgi:ABC-type Zn2+ transport system substrate-binding protein/surface adhesin